MYVSMYAYMCIYIYIYIYTIIHKQDLVRYFIGWANNHFNNPHFRISLETNYVFHYKT